MLLMRLRVLQVHEYAPGSDAGACGNVLALLTVPTGLCWGILGFLGEKKYLRIRHVPG